MKYSNSNNDNLNNNNNKNNTPATTTKGSITPPTSKEILQEMLSSPERLAEVAIASYENLYDYLLSRIDDVEFMDDIDLWYSGGGVGAICVWYVINCCYSILL